MTSPDGGGNSINLAALWVPVMPETSHMGEEMKKAGQESKKAFEEGFNSGSSPESMGSTFGSKLQQSITKEFKGFELPFGASSFLDRFSADIDQKLVAKLKGEAASALTEYRQHWDEVTEAQGRASAAENTLNDMRTKGLGSASSMIPLIQARNKAENDAAEASTKATAAYGNYTTATTKLGEETSKTANGSEIMAGIMGGAMVAGAQLAVGAVESLVEAIGEGFEKAIEITVELGKKVLELGESYEHIGIQIHEFSTASGEDFEELESSAQHVFSQLDVSGNDVGKTMAQFSSILNASGGDVAELTRNVTDLQGRFSTLRATDLGSIFTAFNVPAEEANTALASLLMSARNSGQDLGQLTSALSGDSAVVLHEAGLSLQQAGAFMGDLLKLGPSGQGVMTGLSTAMKDFSSEGLSFGQGMKEAGDRLKELGDTAAGQDLSEKLFGTRKWAVAMQAAQDYVNVIEAVPGAFDAPQGSVQQFIDSTETLGNKVEEFKHQAEDAFKPFGDAAQNVAKTGLAAIATWFAEHRTEIIGDIKHFGDEFIDALPKIQSFTADGIELLGDFAVGVITLFKPVADLMAVAGAGALALAGHFGDAKDLLVAANNFDPTKISDMTKTVADKIRGIKLDTSQMKDDWDNIADSAQAIPTVGSSLLGESQWGTPQGHTPGAPLSTILPPGSSQFPTAPPGTDIFNAPTASAIGGLNLSTIPVAAQKYANDCIDASARIILSHSGINMSEDQLKSVITPGGSIDSLAAGLNQLNPQGNFTAMQGSGGSQQAMFAAIKASIDNGTGSILNVAPGSSLAGHTFAPGHFIAATGYNPDGTINVSDTANGKTYSVSPEDAFQATRGRGIVAGTGTGPAPSGGSGGLSGGVTGGGGLNWDALAQKESGGDWANTSNSKYSGGLQFDAQTWAQNGGLQYAPTPAQASKEDQIKVAQQAYNARGGGATLWPQNYGQLGAPQDNWDHNGVPGGGNGWDLPIGGPGSTPGGKTGPYFPGMAGQYGGNGQYGGETADQVYSTQHAVQEAQDRASDLDTDIAKQQRHIDELKAEINAPDATKTGALGHPLALTPAEQQASDDKKKRLNDELDDATTALAKSQRERSEQNGAITEAQRKQQEAMYKKPSGTTTAAKPTGSAEFEALGGSFLSGIGQELGFGDLFAKPPWEWGAVKLLTGAASWAMGTANAWANEIGKGHTGQTNFQPIPGWDDNSSGLQAPNSDGGSMISGLANSLGVNLPTAKPGVSAGPNVQVNPTTSQHGTGNGQLPGPGNGVVVQGDYMPTHVQAGVDPGQILAPIQEQNNAKNAQQFTHQGGFPAS